MDFLIRLTLCLSILIVSVKCDTFPQCEGVQSKTFVGSPQGCEVYIYCDGDKSFDGICPSGMMFNTADGSCDIESNVVCHNDVSTASPSTTTATVSATITESGAGSPKDKCAKQSSGYFAYPSNCHYYYRCTNGFLSVQECPVGLGWDTKENMCTATGCSS